LHCIVLHCIALYCIALYCIVLYCIALHCIALHTVINVMLLVRHVCSWIVHRSRLMYYSPIGSVFLSVFVRRNNWNFFLSIRDIRTDLTFFKHWYFHLTYARWLELKLNWNKLVCPSVTFVHILTFYIDISILVR
jgi:hypothetical protein